MKPTIPQTLLQIGERYPDYAAQYSKDESGTFRERSYREFVELVEQFAAGLLAVGVSRGDHVGLISENRAEWFIADLGILSIGAIDVPRGNDTIPRDVAYILGFAECRTVLTEDLAQARKVLSVREEIPTLQTLIVLDPAENVEEIAEEAGSIQTLGIAQIYERGSERLKESPDAIKEEIAQGERDDTATLIFTSGTTGTPKGVMLTHGNFLHQVDHVPDLIDVGPGDIWLCVLPVWHSFERIMQYVSLGAASGLAYSKPIGRIMLEDFQKIRPTWMASVPRIWEAIMAGVYRNVKTQSSVKQALFHFFVRLGSAHADLDNKVKGRLPRFEKRNRVLDALLGVVPWLLLWPLRALGNVLVFGKIQRSARRPLCSRDIRGRRATLFGRRVLSGSRHTAPGGIWPHRDRSCPGCSRPAPSGALHRGTGLSRN